MLNLLCCVIALLLALARCGPFVEHVGFISIPPHDDVYYYLRVSGIDQKNLLVWLGHTPGQPINYTGTDSAVPPFTANMSMLMVDLPGVGKTQSNRQVSVESLANFMALVIKYIKDRYSNYPFGNVWIGGEKYMTPLATAIVHVYNGATGLILGNPYLEGRLTVPRRFQIMKHFGLLDIKKEQQFSFLNDLCMRNASLAGCSRIERLFDMVTNRSAPLSHWTGQYLNSVLDYPNYLDEFTDLLKSHTYGLLLYTGQLDLNSGFQRIYSVLQKYSVCSQPEPLTYYTWKTETRGFFKQNDCWTLLELYNSSANVSQTQAELLGELFVEFMENKRLKCAGGSCAMEEEVKAHFPSCEVGDWRKKSHVCSCRNGKYGINCDMEVPERREDEGFRGSINAEEVIYVKFLVTGSGFLLLEAPENCSIDMYANIYAVDDSKSPAYDLPNAGHHHLHSRTNRLHICVGEDKKTAVMLKLHSKSTELCTTVVTYNEYKSQPVVFYGVAALGLGVATILLIVAMVYVRKKLWPQNPTLRSSLIQAVKE